jgi:uncharacterized protein
MEAHHCDALSRICASCGLDGGCCYGARPPLTEERINILVENGVAPETVEFAGYKRLKVKEDGFCVLFKDGHCSVHSIKPETCVAGPFTFDVKGSILEIYLKTEKICPMVEYLKFNRDLYDNLFDLSVANIIKLVENIPSSELAEIVKIEEPDADLVAEIKLKRGLA